MANSSRDSLKLTDLPPVALRRILECLTRKQLVRLRLVNQSLKTAATEQLNGAFFEVEGLLESQLGEVLRAVQIEKHDKSELLLRYRTLRAALCEFRVLMAVVWRRLVLGRRRRCCCCFTGAAILDLLYRVCSPRGAISDDDAATLYRLCDAYLNHEDAVATSSRWRDVGVEMVDLLDCLVSCNHRVFVSAKDRARRICARYEAVGELDLDLFPDIQTRSGQEVTPRGIIQLVRFLRNAIRWNNFLQCIDETLETSLSRALKAKVCPPGPLEDFSDAQSTCTRHVGNPGKNTALSVTLNLLCDFALGPLRLRKRGKLPRKFTDIDVPFGKRSTLSKYELSLDLNVKCGPKDIHRLKIFQGNDGSCVITNCKPQRFESRNR